MNREPAFFAVGNPEALNASSIDEAIEEYIDELFLFCTEGEPDVPEEVQVNGFAPMVIGESDFEKHLENLVEDLDENYSFEGNYGMYELSDQARQIFDRFKEQVKSEFNVTNCEVVGEPLTVKTASYLNKA